MGAMHDPEPKGSIWILEPVTGQVHPAKLVNFPSTADFHPLGIEYDEHNSQLHVINHQRDRNTVEVFNLYPPSDKSDWTAQYAFTLEHPSFTGAPNSLSIIPGPERAFYLSHDHRYTHRTGSLRGKVLNLAETILSLPLSKVDLITFSPSEGSVTSVKTVARGIAFTNGVVLTDSAKTLAVASTTRRQVILYTRNTSTNELTERERIDVPMLVDNLSLAPPGWSSASSDGIVAAGHPFYWPLLLLAKSKTRPKWMPTPMSWVVRLGSAGQEPAEAGGQLYDNAEDKAMKLETERRTTRKLRARIQEEGRDSASQSSWSVDTLFASHGDADKDIEAFGQSTTGVVGVSRDTDGLMKKWMVVVGLYETGVKVVREV